MHHIVSDGWSMGVLVREVAALYAAFLEGRPSPLPELPVQYADFAVWQRSWLTGEVLERELSCWRERLAGAPPVLELPTDRPRPALPSRRGAVHRFALSSPLSHDLAALGRREGATLFMVLLAAFAALLSRLTGQDDLTIGTPIAGRNRSEIEGLIGFFVNTLVFRPDLSAEAGFAELVRRVRTEALQAQAHQELPFERLVEELAPERSLDRAPLFQALLALQNARVDTLILPGLELYPGELLEDVAKFDLSLAFAEAVERDGGIGGSLSYSTELFDAVTMVRFAAWLERLLAAAVASPGSPVATLNLLSVAESQQLGVEWNATASAFPQESLPRLFALQAARRPRETAWVFAGEALSYGELGRRASALASFLGRRGVGKGDLVGLCVVRSAEMLVGLLGILEAGAAYLPLDPAYPRERLALMLEDSAAPLVLTQEKLAERLPAGTRAVRLDTQWEEISREKGAPMGGGATPEDLAYVIYTSGSTGRPKGVAVPHRAVVRLVLGTDYVEIGPQSRIAQLSNLSFDAATFEIWGALLNGATLVGVPEETVLSPAALAAFLEEEEIGVLFLTTALFNQVAQQVPAAFRPLHDVLFGGEAVDPGAVRRVLAAGRPRRLLHVYGPTENTTFSTWYRVAAVEESAATVPIGRPIANTRARLLDGRLQPVPPGVVGELFLGGAGLARGYLNRAELTAELFVVSSAWPGELLYRTGDLARLLPDGNLEFRGRRDQQVKLRGFRIELSEIELALTSLPEIADAAVVLREDLPGGRGLVAWVVPRTAAGPSDLTPSALRGALQQKLPAHMLPAHFATVAALPLTPNGKVDRRGLERAPLPAGAGLAEAGTAPRTPVEELLCGLFAAVLESPPPTIEADFFAMGGHSPARNPARVQGARGLRRRAAAARRLRNADHRRPIPGDREA